MAEHLTLGRVSVQLQGDTRPHAMSGYRNHLNTALHHADLMPAGFPPQAILIVRHFADPAPGLLMTGAPWNAGRRWGADARAHLTDEWRSAARPLVQSVPTNTNAVWFYDRAEWLACLTSDLMVGVAHQRWWWQTTLSASPIRHTSSPIAVVWSRYAASVPPAVAPLRTHRGVKAIDVIARLPGHTLRTLRQQIARAYDITPAAADVQLPMDLIARLPDASEITRQVDSEVSQTVAFVLSLVYAVADLRRALTADNAQPEIAPTTADRSHPTQAEASATEDLSKMPQTMARGHAFVERGTATTDALTPEPANPTPSQPQPAQAEIGHSPQDNAADLVDSLAKAQPADDVHRRATLDSFANDLGIGTGQTTADGANIIAEPHPQKPDLPVTTRLEGLSTELGGAWYLINILILMDLLGEGRILWAQLDALARLLLGDEVPDDALWPLLEDLAAQNGIVALPDSPTMRWAQKTLPHIQGWVQARPGNLDDLRPVLFQQARVHVSSERIDVMYSIEEINMDCRIAGLDRDPGWLPELPRAIRFHFV